MHVAILNKDHRYTGDKMVFHQYMCSPELQQELFDMDMYTADHVELTEAAFKLDLFHVPERRVRFEFERMDLEEATYEDWCWASSNGLLDVWKFIYEIYAQLKRRESFDMP